jgi:hypothetical protein
MDEHYQHDNAGRGAARVHELASEAPGGDGKEPHQGRDQGRVDAFEAKVEEIGKNTKALGRKVRSFSDSGDVITAGGSIYTLQRQVVDFYGMRLHKNFEFGRRFAGAARIGELIGLQQEYVRDMLIDYASSVYAMAGFGLPGARQTAERLDRSE